MLQRAACAWIAEEGEPFRPWTPPPFFPGLESRRECLTLMENLSSPQQHDPLLPPPWKAIHSQLLLQSIFQFSVGLLIRPKKVSPPPQPVDVPVPIFHLPWREFPPLPSSLRFPTLPGDLLDHTGRPLSPLLHHP